MSRALQELSNEFSGENATYEVSTEMHRAVYETIDSNDPYKDKKKIGNKIANDLFPEIEQKIKESEDGFKKAILASIIANSLDFGVLEHEVNLDDLHNKFPKKIDESDLDVDDSESIKREIEKADEIAIVADNCGEIIFDKLLINEIKKISSGKIVLYVRGEPIFNDVTLKEAEEASITEVVDEVVELGERAVGFHPKYVPKDVKEKLFDSDFIISKGMANYESFSEIDDLNISYIFKAKCGPVADSIDASVGENIALKK